MTLLKIFEVLDPWQSDTFFCHSAKNVDICNTHIMHRKRYMNKIRTPFGTRLSYFATHQIRYSHSNIIQPSLLSCLLPKELSER